MSFLLLLLLWIVVEMPTSRCDQEGESNKGETVTITKRMEGCIIVDHNRKHTVSGKRRYANAQDIEALFSSLDLVMHLSKSSNSSSSGATPLVPPYEQTDDTTLYKIKEWPAVYTGICPDSTPLVRCPGGKCKPPGADRGMLVVHRECWDQFIRRREASEARKAHFSEDQEVLLIFEDDAFATVPNVGKAVVMEIEAMDKEVLWIGWCMHSDPEAPPLCMHSYAMTISGARKLLQKIDTCHHDALDIQIQRAGKEKWFTYGMTDATPYFENGNKDHIFNEIKGKGITIDETLKWVGYGGLFTQVVFDDPIEEFEEDTLVKPTNSRTVYIWRNNSLHAFPDQHTFESMGFDFDDEVYVSEWQFNRLPVGEELPSIHRNTAMRGNEGGGGGAKYTKRRGRR